MVPLICLGAFGALVIVAAFLRVAVEFEYSDGDVTAHARALFMRFDIYPRVKKRAVKKTKRVKKAEPAAKAKLDIRALTQTAVRVLLKLRRRVLIKRLSLTYIAGGRDNPAGTAITHGVITGVLGVTRDVLETAFRVKEYELFSNVNFLASDSMVHVSASFSVAVWEIVFIAFGELTMHSKKNARDDARVKKPQSARKERRGAGKS